MKCFLAFVVIATLGVFTIGCDSTKNTTQDKIQTTTTQTKDGKVVGETTTTNETKTIASEVPPSSPISSMSFST